MHAEDSIALIEKAMATATRMHEGQFRKSGEPYIIHPFQVGYILAQLQTGPSTICAGLLHDVLEDCDCTREEMVAEFGEEIITLVEAVTNVGKLNFTDEKEYEAVNHRRIFIAMAKDVRVILVKLVDRLHNMRTLEFQPPHKQKKKAEETMAVYAPIAHRLGISEIKNELEDLCFYYLNREKYYEIARLVDKKQSIRNAQVNQMIEDIKGYLEVEGIEARVFGRSKHLYSIYKKMTTKNKRFDEILDLLAIRIVTKSETNCYEILGIIHAAYKPIPGRFKDYIAMPKANMYQSLHTTIVGEEGNIFEVQIRTEEMDSVAELGIASHWSYKEGKSLPSKEEQKQIEDKLAWFRDILDFSEDDSDAVGYMDTLKHDIFEANVYVMSPMGRVIDLPNGSTPLDFAYRIHTDVGHQTIGATVNGILVPLNTTLKTGDVVNIRTSKQSNGPSEDWLKIVKSNQAKNKIRSFLAKKDAELKSKYTDKGEEMLIAELKKRGFDEKEYMDPKKFEHIYGQFAVSNYQDFMYAIAVKSLSTQSVIDKLTNTTAKKPMDADSIQKYYEERKNAFQNKKKYSKSGIMVSGVDSMMIELAGCCSPIPGDDIAGYISKGKGVKVHRKACPNIANEKARLIDVEWDESYSSTEKYRADLLIEASDRNLLLSDIITMTSQCKTGIQSVTAQVAEDRITALVKLTITVDNLAHLNNTIANLKKVESVIGVQRVIH
ncbi:MAG: bifunctional (p)ppGpp synthetase/guanosine-3',5'-bis(diphosphate) 3'-pyrophosphohydrolase [Erysipelotrichales bacterium]|nr:bifunctional (p)ppGpp synthetase/guanosine-3',5'-bis(diphosphate) 3'-pyrophosphohydrolase [Erysipelotrichales bacterium]